MLLGSVIVGLVVPFITFRFVTELMVEGAARSAVIWRSTQEPRVAVTLTMIGVAIGMVVGAFIGLRFWRHFLNSVVPRLLSCSPIPGQSQERAALPQWLRRHPAWWLMVAAGYVIWSMFGAGVVGIVLLVPTLMLLGYPDGISIAWHTTWRPGTADYKRGLVALFASILSGPLVAATYSAVSLMRAVEA